MIELSIITVCYNSEATILETIKSIKTQSFQNFEYIIIDGGSKDSTIQIASDNLEDLKNITIISEPDEGIYDAMNKGIDKSRGTLISILNSDDLYYNENVLYEVVQCFNDHNADIVYGNTLLLNSNNRVIRNIIPGNFKKGSFYWGWFPFHPSTFVRRSVYEKIGKFNKSLPIAADFEFLLRAFELYDFKIQFLNQPLAIMRQGGESTGTLKNIIKGMNECKKAFNINNIPLNPLYSIFRISRILHQYLKTLLFKNYRIISPTS